MNVKCYMFVFWFTEFEIELMCEAIKRENVSFMRVLIQKATAQIAGKSMLNVEFCRALFGVYSLDIYMYYTM